MENPMRKLALSLAILSVSILLLALVLTVRPPNTQARSATVVSVSGTISGPSGVVPNIWIGVSSPEDWKPTTTNAGGFYSVLINTSGELWFYVRPDVATRLTQVNHYQSGITTTFTQNFTLTNGYLLSLRYTDSGGAPITGNIWTEMQPLAHTLADNYWYSLDWDEASQHFWAVLPPDAYYVRAWHLPIGYYDTTATFDLRSADRTLDMPLNTMYVHPIPYDPPDASKLTIGAPDSLGEATITGSAGAALPLAHVLLVNLNSTHQGHAYSNADGSFSARLYAPPGSAIMIKHGPASSRWNDLSVGVSEMLNPFPGTIIHVPYTYAGNTPSLPFAAAGAIDHFADDPRTTLNYVSSAWAVTGTFAPIIVDGEWTRVLTGTYQSSVVPGLYRGGFNWTHPALADLDNDGDLDLVIGERSGTLVLYRNRGNAASPDWKYEAADYAGVHTGGWAYPALVDVTNDGAPDLFVGTGSGSVLIYYNDGTSSAPIWPATPDVTLSAGNNAAPALDDLDGDGDLDLLVGHEGGTLYYFKNTGTPTNPTWSLQTSDYGGINEAGGWLQPAFLDLDGDTDRDLLIGLCGQLLWYQRGGTAATPTWTRNATDPIGFAGGSCATSPGIGDWDGDGDRDVVTGEHWGNLRFFRNNGAPSWSEASFEFPFELLGDTAPAFADWDNDGDLDMLIGQAHGNVERYTNIGSAANSNWRPDGTLLTLPWTNHPHAFPTFADIDGDHDEDLFIGEGGWQGPGAGGNIYYYRNAGTPSSPSWTLVVTNFLGLDVGGWSRPVFVDIDHDNDLDLFVGDEDGTLTFVQNIGTSTSPAWAAPIHPYAGLDVGAYSAPAFFDVDQDGDLDMLIGSENGSLAYVRNTGTPSNPTWELVSTQYPGIDIGDNSTPAAADLDGDAHPDLLIGDGDGGLNYYHYVGPGSPPPPDNVYAPNELFRIDAQLRLVGPAITSTTDVNAITVNSWLGFMMLYNAQGKPIPAESYFMSSLLTPSGFPIQRVERPVIYPNVQVNVGNLHYTGGHTIEGDFTFSGQIPADLPLGVYRPLIHFNISGVPTSTNWLAANVVYHTINPDEAALPLIVVNDGTAPGVGSPQRLIWKLLMDDFVQGTRGSSAHEDSGLVGFTSQIVSQGAPQVVPPIDERTGQSLTYRLEPFLPMVSYTDRRMPTPPLIPFDLPGGTLHVAIREPDGTLTDLGTEAFAQSFNRTKTTRAGQDLNGGTVQLEDVYSLKVASDRFRVTFDQYGHHVITMTGTISDVWGNHYVGGGTYDVWVAHPLDIDPGVLPMTPLAVGDAFNPTLIVYPRVAADVRIVVTLYPNSNPAQAITRTLIGVANRYGYFNSSSAPITLTAPGEYRVDVTAAYTDTSGKMYMGSLTWGDVVMTPNNQTNLIAHGRRGLDTLLSIPNHWFVSSRDLTIPPGAISHSLNPYYNGDIFWSRMSDNPYGGDSLVLGASVQDTIGTIATTIQARANRMNPPLYAPGSMSERFSKNEIPLFSSTRSGLPVQVAPNDVDQIAYSYRTSQRPGLRVREVVAEDGQSGGYWRLDTLYDDQLSVGVLGDLPNDCKFQYVGVVYRDLGNGHSEYLGQGTGWVFIPDSDPTGSRVMPPFAGPGNGGWTTEGGPLLRLKGQDIHMFILPTGVAPGAVLEVGDAFHFAGHLMPTLNSKVAVTVTAPSGVKHIGDGQASSIGYFYDPSDNFTIDEAGLWSVDVRVWHDGQCSGGSTIPPYPSGDVLGSDAGRYWFYVAPSGAAPLIISSPSPGFLRFDNQVTPITITGAIPTGLSHVTVDYTIAMPGYILKHGQVTPSGSTFQFVFDPATLAQDFPNLDLNGRDDRQAGLADTFTIGVLLRGQSGGQSIQRANVVTLQGNQVFVGESSLTHSVFLPLVLKGN
jgi:hypothetical protein